jgi:hypothetical protein
MAASSHQEASKKLDLDALLSIGDLIQILLFHVSTASSSISTSLRSRHKDWVVVGITSPGRRFPF